MWRYLILIGASAVVAAQYGMNLTQRLETAPQGEVSQPALTSDVQKSAPKAQEASYNPLDGRIVRIKMDNRGHFVTKAKLNGRRAEVLVDTGATAVAINKSMARRIGIQLSQSDFKYKVKTANGVIKAASAVIKDVQIGRVLVKNVRASIVDDKSLDGVLLGMSFLGQLDKFSVENGTLILKQ